MSTIIRCDGYDCVKCDHSHDETFYSLSQAAKELIVCYGYDESIEHLCLDCFKEINEEVAYKLTTFEACEIIILKE